MFSKNASNLVEAEKKVGIFKMTILDLIIFLDSSLNFYENQKERFEDSEYNLRCVELLQWRIFTRYHATYLMKLEPENTSVLAKHLSRYSLS